MLKVYLRLTKLTGNKSYKKNLNTENHVENKLHFH